MQKPKLVWSKDRPADFPKIGETEKIQSHYRLIVQDNGYQDIETLEEGQAAFEHVGNANPTLKIVLVKVTQEIVERTNC